MKSAPDVTKSSTRVYPLPGDYLERFTVHVPTCSSPALHTETTSITVHVSP